jgi:hypothetical protein
MRCDELRDDVLDVLYGEADVETTRRVDAHRAACPACREELEALRRVRRDLSAWRQPAAAPPLAAPRASRGDRRAWLAAAAGMLLALAGTLVLGGAEVRYEGGGFSARLGRSRLAELERAVSEMEARHRAEVASLETALGRRGGEADEGALLRRVQSLIDDHQRRQDLHVRDRLARFEARSEAQRRDDLSRVRASLTYLDGKAGLRAAQTTELLGQLLKASQPR